MFFKVVFLLKLKKMTDEIKKKQF